ncbi:hypothetical protein CDAR_182111, partial [Caerostris darwini]
ILSRWSGEDVQVEEPMDWLQAEEPMEWEETPMEVSQPSPTEVSPSVSKSQQPKVLEEGTSVSSKVRPVLRARVPVPPKVSPPTCLKVDPPGLQEDTPRPRKSDSNSIFPTVTQNSGSVGPSHTPTHTRANQCPSAEALPTGRRSSLFSDADLRRAGCLGWSWNTPKRHANVGRLPFKSFREALGELQPLRPSLLNYVLKRPINLWMSTELFEIVLKETRFSEISS